MSSCSNVLFSYIASCYDLNLKMQFAINTIRNVTYERFSEIVFNTITFTLKQKYSKIFIIYMVMLFSDIKLLIYLSEYNFLSLQITQKTKQIKSVKSNEINSIDKSLLKVHNVLNLVLKKLNGALN